MMIMHDALNPPVYTWRVTAGSGLYRAKPKDFAACTMEGAAYAFRNHVGYDAWHGFDWVRFTKITE